RQPCTEEMNGRHKHEPREHSAGEDHARHAWTNDVADAEIFRSRGSPNGSAGIRLQVPSRCAWPCCKEIFILEQRVKCSESQAPEHAASEAAAAISSNEHISAGCAFGIGENSVLLHDQLPPKRDHEEDADESSDQA